MTGSKVDQSMISRWLLSIEEKGDDGNYAHQMVHFKAPDTIAWALGVTEESQRSTHTKSFLTKALTMIQNGNGRT